MTGWADGANLPPVDIRRRQVLTVLATIAAGGLPALAAAVARGESGVEIAPDTLTDPGGAGRFGRAYLADFPAEADREALLKSLEAALLAEGPAVPVDAEAVFMRLDRRVRAEYIRGDIVLVDGWLLSRSEARLYALSVLSLAA